MDLEARAAPAVSLARNVNLEALAQPRGQNQINRPGIVGGLEVDLAGPGHQVWRRSGILHCEWHPVASQQAVLSHGIAGENFDRQTLPGSGSGTSVPSARAGADRFTIRVGDHYRAPGQMAGNEMSCTHADYDRLVGSRVKGAVEGWGVFRQDSDQGLQAYFPFLIRFSASRTPAWAVSGWPTVRPEMQ